MRWYYQASMVFMIFRMANAGTLPMIKRRTSDHSLRTAFVAPSSKNLGKKGRPRSLHVIRGGSVAPVNLATTLVPVAGVFITNAMTAAGLPAIRKARKEGTLGRLNALPFVMVLGNCVAWVLYGLILGNPYIFLSNAPGCLFGLFMFSSGVLYGSPAQSVMLERVALAMASVLLVSNGVGAILLGPSRHSKIAAVVANIFTLAFYSAPLSAVGQIIRTKDASPLYPPMVVMSLVNGLLWTVYGLAIGEMGVALPNGIGAFLSLCQLALLLSFRKPHTPSTHKK